MICSGAVTKLIKDPPYPPYTRQMPEPKFVVAVGTCALLRPGSSRDVITSRKGSDKSFRFGLHPRLPGEPGKP